MTPSAQGCEECLICGHVGCYDSSPDRDATAHYHATGHPIVCSFELGEDWRWCYVDEVLVLAKRTENRCAR